MSEKQVKRLRKVAKALTIGKPSGETEKVYQRLKVTYKQKAPK